MSWDDTVLVELGEEWPGFWIRFYADPPMGDFEAMRECGEAALRGGLTPDLVDTTIKSIRPLIAEHNLTDRDGHPLDWDWRAMNRSLLAAVIGAGQRAYGVDPGPFETPASSPGRSSQARRSRRASRSTG